MTSVISKPHTIRHLINTYLTPPTHTHTHSRSTRLTDTITGFRQAFSHGIREQRTAHAKHELHLGRPSRGRSEKLVQPAALDDGTGDGTVLCFSTRARDSGRTLGRPRHQGVAEVDAVARCGDEGVEAPYPVRRGPVPMCRPVERVPLT